MNQISLNLYMIYCTFGEDLKWQREPAKYQRPSAVTPEMDPLLRTLHNVQYHMQIVHDLNTERQIKLLSQKELEKLKPVISDEVWNLMMHKIQTDPKFSPVKKWLGGKQLFFVGLGLFILAMFFSFVSALEGIDNDTPFIAIPFLLALPTHAAGLGISIYESVNNERRMGVGVIGNGIFLALYLLFLAIAIIFEG